MAIDELPGEIVTLTRDEFRNLFTKTISFSRQTQRLVRGRSPTSTVARGGCDARDRERRRHHWQRHEHRHEHGHVAPADRRDEGVFKLPAAGASGYVVVTTAVGGSTIFQGDEVTEQASGLRFLVQATALYGNGALVPIVGLDTGDATNLNAGTVLKFPRRVLGATNFATVYEDSNGNGLTGDVR